MVRVGVFGAGWVAQARHIPAFRRHPDVEVVAIFDRSAERAAAAAAAAAAAKFGVVRHYSDSKAFFEEQLDIVSICTPPWVHAEQTIDALERGVHVFVEKPMAMNVVDAQAMVDASNAARRLLCVSHNFLFSRSIQRADQLVASSPPHYVLGLQMSSTLRRLPEWYTELPGGLLLDESPHMLYTLQHYLGPLELLNAHATFNAATGLPATTELLIRGPNGTGRVTMLFEAPISEWHIGLVSPERVVSVDIFRDIVVDLGSDGAHLPLNILATSGRATAAHAKGLVASGSRYVTRRLLWGHDLVIGRFVDATLGRGPVPVPAADSLNVVRLTDAILNDLSLTPR